MKTAMKELIEYMQELNTRSYVNGTTFMEGTMNHAKKLLEKEKKQITDACWYGHDIKHEYFNPIHYFDQTYNQNK